MGIESGYGYYYEDMGMGMVAVLFYLIYILVVMGVSIGAYILQSVGMYSIAKRRGIKNPWLAWIPVGSQWILGCISDQYRYVSKRQVKNKRKAMLVLQIVLWLLGIAIIALFFTFAAKMMGMAFNQAMMPGYGPGIGVSKVVASGFGAVVLGLAMSGVSIAMTVIQYMALYDLYQSCEPKNGTLYLVLSIFFSITLPIFVFLCRNKDEGMPPRKTEPEYVPQVEEIPLEDYFEE